VIISPISKVQEKQVIDATQNTLNQAEVIHKTRFRPIDVRFDLKGRAAGMYRVQRRKRVIRYNPYLFAKYFDHNLQTTVPHEVAHYVTDMLFGLRNIQPHGKQWQAVMLSLGADPAVTGDYDLTGIPVRRQRRFHYQCACSEHQVSTVRHKRVMRGDMKYLCRACHTEIAYLGEQDSALS